MASLADQIKQLSCPKPTNFDPEEDDFDITRATLVNKNEEEDIDGKNLGSSALRKKNASFLSDEDRKYHGRRVSRSDMAKLRGDFMESDESADDLDNQDDSDKGNVFFIAVCSGFCKIVGIFCIEYLGLFKFSELSHVF